MAAMAVSRMQPRWRCALCDRSLRGIVSISLRCDHNVCHACVADKLDDTCPACGHEIVDADVKFTVIGPDDEGKPVRFAVHTGACARERRLAGVTSVAARHGWPNGPGICY